MRVAVFVHSRKRGHLLVAYLRDYNADWSGCNIIDVDAKSGKEAKAAAIAKVKALLLSGEPVSISDA